MPIRPRRPSPALIVALLALFVALGGPAQARKLINGKDIRKGTVASKQVDNRSLRVRDLRRGAVRSLRATPPRSIGTTQLADGAVGAAQLQVASVTAAALAPNSITGLSLADATIGTLDLADGTVNSAKIANGEVRKVDIAGGAVGTSEIQSSAVTGGEVRDGSLSAKDLGAFSGVLDVTVPPIPADDCVTLPPASTPPSVPNETLTDDIVLVGRPQTWPTDLTLDAQPVSDTSLSLTVCNLGAPTAAATAHQVRFTAIEP